ncbi:MAG: 16S rRNA (guanine(527)-N(7))-methyltransferase RsmG [Clostridia bacterium]|nr:16S rRNA (guanine(527)-N(7))-methyltransferase RsmG [Clostridia bacterium]
MKNLEIFLETNNVANATAKAELLLQYMNEILEWNKKVNLTAITDTDEFVQKHFIDSLLVIDSEEFNNSKTVIDVGTGGGFPGVPLAVCFPEKNFLLMDSLAKRIRIVNEICGKLGIKNVKAVHGRAEEMARQKDMRDSFDLCVSRAVANMSTLSEYCLPFVKKGGTFIAYKGPDCESEIEEANHAIHVLGGKVSRIENPKLSETDFEHKLVFVLKEKDTPKTYPRKAGKPGKEPIKRK